MKERLQTLITQCGQFLKKPLVIGGCAMEFYNLRSAGEDIDMVVGEGDYYRLSHFYPKISSSIADEGLQIEPCGELWKTSWGYTYEQLRSGAIEEEAYCVISREALFFLKSLSANLRKDEKSVQDAYRLALAQRSSSDWKTMPDKVPITKINEGG